MAKARSVGTRFVLGANDVGGIKSIGGVEASADTTDVTALDNQSGYREFVAGFKDGGEISLSGFFDGEDAGQVALLSAFESGGSVSCKIVFPAGIGKTWSFSGVVTKVATSADVDGAVTFDATIKVSGAPTLANSSALSSIAVTTAPTTTAYTAGQDFNPAGMVVKATYADSTQRVITNYTVVDGQALTQGKTSVTIYYAEGTVSKTTTQAITVAAAG